MVQAIDNEAVEGDMDQEAVEGAVDGASDGRSDGWYKLWIRNVQAMSSRMNVQAMSRRRY
jgi:hypothetical protein